MLEFPLNPSNAVGAASDAAREAGRDAAGAGPLRVPVWSELTARLTAARDLRGVLAMDAVGVAGSFTRFTALAEADVNDEPRSVNLTGLVDSKCDQGTVPASQGDGQVAGFIRADREMR